MLLNSSTRLIFSALLFGLLTQSMGWGETLVEGEGSIEFGLGFYDNGDDGDGNPFLDESLTVVEPVVVFDYNLSDDTAVWGKLSYDYVSSASIDRLSKFPEQSGASGDYYIGLEGGMKKMLPGDKSWGLFGHASVEYDYRSFGLGGDYSFPVNDDSGTLSLSANGFVDQVDIIRFNGASEGTDTRLSFTTQLNGYQIMNPLLHAEYGGVLTVQNGFLETPYNAVVIEDTDVPNPNLVGNAPGREVTEELDDSRIRSALFGNLRYSLTELDALQLGGRLYTDTWGITGISLETRWYRWLIQDSLKLRLRYRFYTQTEADDYQETFLTETEFRTQDSDLAAFNAQTLGAKLSFFTNENNEVHGTMDYVSREDGLDQILVHFAYRRTF